MRLSVLLSKDPVVLSYFRIEKSIVLASNHHSKATNKAIEETLMLFVGMKSNTTGAQICADCFANPRIINPL